MFFFVECGRSERHVPSPFAGFSATADSICLLVAFLIFQLGFVLFRREVTLSCVNDVQVVRKSDFEK